MKENKGGVFVPKLQEMMTEKNKKLPPLISGGWVGGQGGGGQIATLALAGLPVRLPEGWEVCC